MVEHVLTETTEEQPRARWPYREEIWQALVGIDDFTRNYWEERHRELAEQSRQLFERWISCGRVYGCHLAAFARWLGLAAAEPIRLPGLVWLDSALTGDGAEHIIDRPSTTEPVASLLNVVWREDESRLRRDPAAFAAFRHLLRWLADHQNANALNLLGRLGRLV